MKATKPPTYTIKDTLGEPVQGTFYEQERQLRAQEIFRIERVLKKKKNQAFVKRKGHSNAFNSWVPLTDLEACISISNMLGSRLKSRENNPLLPRNLRGLVIGKSGYWENYSDL